MLNINNTKNYLSIKFKPLFICALFLGLLGLPFSAAAATVTDRIVALVNNEIITLSDLNNQIRAMPQSQKASLPKDVSLEEQVLNYMIEIELINQVARRDGLMVPEQEVDAAIASIIAENNITEAQFWASIGQSGLSRADFRSNLKIEILKDKVLRYNILRKVVVTDKEVSDFLTGQGPSISGIYVGGSNENDRVRLLFLASNPSRSNQIMERAATIRREIEAGLLFSEAARRYSEGPGAENGGDMDTTIGELQPQLKAIALSLAPGQVSESLDGGQAVLLMYIDPRTEGVSSGGVGTPGSGASLGDFSPQQKDMARRQLEQHKAMRKYEAWLSDLKAKANIKITL
jgi:peptidyl-prolyl cis-trans isomerase SurA